MTNIQRKVKNHHIRKTYEMWAITIYGNFKMIGTCYFNRAQVVKEMKANPHIHLVLHKGKFRMYWRMIIARAFGNDGIVDR